MNKAYVIRRKITKIKPTPIPETTYRPPSARRLRKVEPIVTPEFFNDLARPKEERRKNSSKQLQTTSDYMNTINDRNINLSYNDTKSPTSSLNDEVYQHTSYMTEIPEYSEVDYRVTHYQLQRDEYLMNQKEKRIADEKASEPIQFNEWKKKMQEEDDKIRREEIEKRHLELDKTRKRAKKAKKILIEKQLNDGTQIREEIRKQLEQTQLEIEAEREEIRRLKSEIVDGAPLAVAKVQQNNREVTKEIKQKLREDIKMMHRRLNDEYQQRRDNAEIVRQRAINHELTNQPIHISTVKKSTGR